MPASLNPHARVASIDLLKGLVMIIMALDHVRDYFHASAFLFDPADPLKSNLAIFFTRWITHFCAPAFSFLAGISAFLAGKRRTKTQLSGFLFKRGLWLIIMEITIVAFGWYFDWHFRSIGLLVLWSLGISMILLAGLVFLPRQWVLVFSLLLIFGHNLLDGFHFPGSIGWSLLHEQQFFPLNDRLLLLVGYPVIPWVAVMSLGYCFGHYYESGYDASKRRRLFNGLGAGAVLLFLILRFTNVYGDPKPFIPAAEIVPAIISFFNPSKYPPSLLYLLMTLGGALLFLANTENASGKLVNAISTFGRVPFFYYIIHIYLIHLLALVFAALSGFDWHHFILSKWIGLEKGFDGYGFRLWVVYAVWIGIIMVLYPVCKWFDRYKQNNKQVWWLSYL